MKEKLRRLPDSELVVMQALWRADAAGAGRGADA